MRGVSCVVRTDGFKDGLQGHEGRSRAMTETRPVACRGRVFSYIIASPRFGGVVGRLPDQRVWLVVVFVFLLCIIHHSRA